MSYNQYPPNYSSPQPGYPPHDQSQGYGQQQHGYPPPAPQYGDAPAGFGPPQRVNSYGPPQHGGFQHGQAGGQYGSYDASNPQGQSGYYGGQAPPQGQPGYDPYPQQQPQYGQPPQQQQQQPYYDPNNPQHQQQQGYPPQDPNAPYDPNAPEGERGLGGAIAGGLAGRYAGNRRSLIMAVIMVATTAQAMAEVNGVAAVGVGNAMEVFVRNLPEQTTEKQAKAIFRPVLANLDVNYFHCHKPRGKGFAKLTISEDDIRKGERFLDLHGQVKPGREGFSGVKRKIFHMNRPINCSLSNTRPDEYILRSLDRERAERRLVPHGARSNASALGVNKLRRRYNFSLLQCGQMDYAGSNLAFADHFNDLRTGHMTFTRRFILIDLHPMDPSEPVKQMELPYSSIESVLIGKSINPHVTFLLAEAPKFFEKTPDDASSLLTNFATLRLQHTQSKQPQPNRRRITALTPSHQLIVSTCLCYRFQIHSSDLQAIQALKRLPTMPRIIQWDILQTSQPSIALQMTQLNTLLAATADKTLSFEVKFQVQKLVMNGYLPPYKTLKLVQLIKKTLPNVDQTTLAAAVRRLTYQIPFPDPGTEASELLPRTLCKLVADNYEMVVREKTYSVDVAEQYEQLISIHKASVTPAGIYLYGPEPEMKNRILRKYAAFSSYFLQVTFSDEDGEAMRYDRTASLKDIYHHRFKKVLESNITVAGRPYEFLGFSHSSLREQTCFFMAPFVWNGEIRHSRAVIKDLGDFSAIRSPAKCAARIGQAFSQAFSAVDIPPSAFQRLPEVERIDSRGIKRTFSDGVGTCSKPILERIWAAYGQSRAYKPTVCQIRYAEPWDNLCYYFLRLAVYAPTIKDIVLILLDPTGAKGMISLDERLTGDVLCLRPSMIKFEAHPTQIEICGAGFKTLPMYLNRQLIKILEDLGVPAQAFMDLQAEAVEQLRYTTENPINAGYYLQRNLIGKAARLPWLVRKLSYIGLSFSDDSFLRDTLELAVLIQLRELKYRSRIFVERGFLAYGIMDETDFLEEGQIFCSVRNQKTGLVLTGRVIITRCPALHPGDVQYVEAVDVPQYSPLRAVHNCVVFSSKGIRDLPSQLSGGDLDGDLYNIIFDDSLMPTKLAEPADYPTAPPIDIRREVERSDITDFFVNFMENDQLGRIATLHQTIADQRPQGVFDPDCILLAELHSTAVDFSKTGIPVDLSKIPKSSNVRPDFQAPGPRVLIQNSITMQPQSGLTVDDEDEEDEGEALDSVPATKYYESFKVLGQLYRAIDEQKFFEEIQRWSKASNQLEHTSLADKVWAYVHSKTALIQYEHYLRFARDVKEAYEDNMVDTMMEHSAHPTHFVSEVEVFVGALLGKEGAQTKRQREFSSGMKDKHDRDVAYTVQCILQGEDEDSSKEEALERSIACLYVAVHEVRTRPRFGRLVSFTWVAAAICLKEVEKFIGA
ncbi:MAG: hypothetical protein Q9174_002555 [Haloplaca sp. 1 TL-2023]